ncbi:MAG TPA: hypothetical protein VHV57_05760 [Acidimicrobiales bacterium]|jgi:hypothetical protein|nr:hypothetical protein [Acidimicrobiales bacterium]
MLLHKAKFGIGIAAVGMAAVLIPAAPALAGVHTTATVAASKGSNPNSTVCKLEKAQLAQESSKQETALETALEAGNWKVAQKDLTTVYNAGLKSENQLITSLKSAPSKVQAAIKTALKAIPAEEKAVKNSKSVAQFEKAEEKAVTSSAFTKAGKVVETYITGLCGPLTATPPTT